MVKLIALYKEEHTYSQVVFKAKCSDSDFNGIITDWILINYYYLAGGHLWFV